jgi:thiosulfate reductase cytochrome b subunit
MADGADDIAGAGQSRRHAVRIYRHPLPVRLCHWINALSLILLFLSGMQIFNAHPRLYIGHVGYYDQPAVFEITGNKNMDDPRSWIAIGSSWRIDTTGVLGEIVDGPPFGVHHLAFPSWFRLPSSNDLGKGRGWHFLAAWLFVINGAIYMIYGLVSRRFWRELLPRKAQLRWGAIVGDIVMHLRFRHPVGEAARSYNLLQKLAYLTVIFLLLPTMVLTGMTMSNSAVAVFPWLIDLFGGRQTARTLHFVVAFAMFLFLFVHILQIFVAGFRREMRSMITGYYELPGEKRP